MMNNALIVKKNNGFTLIELVMTIVLTGILAVGLYEVVMFGINDYMGSEQYLHSTNSTTYAMSVVRRNLEEAATPPTQPISPSGTVYCPLSNGTEPSSTNPVSKAYLSGGNSSASCGGTGQPACNEIALYQNITVNGITNQQLVVFYVYNNTLYEETTYNGLTTPYPIADNINGISF